MPNAEGVQIQSVTRAMEILDCFNGSSEQLGITEISARMSLSKSTIYGLVNTLLSCGMLERIGSNKQYRLGIKLFQLGMLVQKRMDLHRDAQPFCEALSQKYNATVHLAARYGSEIVYIDKVDAPDTVIVYSQTGKCAPAHCTGVGKAILAFLPETEQKSILKAKGMPIFTPHTIATPAALEQELKQICKQGYALDMEEIELGLRCVAAPIFGHDGSPVAAVSVSAPAIRLPEERISQIAGGVRYCASQISDRLGYIK